MSFKMRVQIHSDIHIEKYPRRRLRSQASHLILAGDIGVPVFTSFREFFRDTSREFDKIIYVLGNHEYERTWMGIDKNNYSLLEEKFNQRNNLVHQIISEFKNIILLDNSSIVLNNKIIFGSTLWTNYHQRRSDKTLSTVEQFITQQHFIALPKIQHVNPHLLITHYVSNRSFLKKPWSIGLGPSTLIRSPRTIFGHIHYTICEENASYREKVFCNPWGEEESPKEMFVDLD